MTKAILVIDMPANCMQCRFRDGDWCSVDDYAKSDGSLVIHRHEHDFKRHESCPLKPIPEKKFVNENFLRVAVSQEYDLEIGYNQCLDDILGGTHE